MQLEAKPFKMSIKPLTYQVILDRLTEVLYCRAHANLDLMSGKWINVFNGEEMKTLIEK